MSGDDTTRTEEYRELAEILTVNLSDEAMKSNDALRAIIEIMQSVSESTEGLSPEAICWLGDQLFKCHKIQLTLFDVYDKVSRHHNAALGRDARAPMTAVPSRTNSTEGRRPSPSQDWLMPVFRFARVVMSGLGHQSTGLPCHLSSTCVSQRLPVSR